MVQVTRRTGARTGRGTAPASSPIYLRCGGGTDKNAPDLGTDSWCFWFGGCSILYNRGVYPEESFARVKKYGLPMLLTQDEAVKSFITNLTSQLSGSLAVSPSRRHADSLGVSVLLICICMLLGADCCRVAGGGAAAEDRVGHHEQGHRRGARALELQHRH